MLPEFLGSTSAKASRFRLLPMLGSMVENAGFGGSGRAGRMDTSGHPVAGGLGVSEELRSDQAGSARGVGESEGEAHGTILVGEDDTLTGRGDGLFRLGDF